MGPPGLLAQCTENSLREEPQRGYKKIILDRYEIVPLSLTAPDSVEGRPQNNLIRMTDQF